ncbi:protein kinase [Dactylosporangium sp. NPDC006015]|uniref:protein kinase n=1 Tax=Dactylosporangium sp. NPDC006015 TaxID=3154576 RepID=UPI0033B819B3
MADEVVTAGQLGALGRLLGTGGQARVYEAPHLRLPDAPGPLVYKEYKPESKARQGPRQLVKFRNGLEPAGRAKLDSFTAWPLRVVEDGSQVSGVIMPLIDPSFMQLRTLPGTGTKKTSTREVQNLLVPPQRAALVGMPVVTAQQRLTICRDLAAALHWLHAMDLVFGDLNARNELFRLSGHPSVMLVDCDGVRKKGTMAEVAQLDAPDWDAPEGWLTTQSDCYKFGLFVLRVFSSGDQQSTTRDPARADAALDDDGRQLLRATLSEVPGSRPPIEDWGYYFRYRLTGKPPPAADPARTVPQPRPAAVVPAAKTTATTGWIRDRVTGRWTPL